MQMMQVKHHSDDHQVWYSTHRELLNYSTSLFCIFLARNSVRQAFQSARKRSKKKIEDPKKNQWKRKWFRKPFLLELLKLNEPERYYLVLGCFCSFLFGCVEPAVGLLYSIIYGLFGNAHINDISTKTRNLSFTIFGVYALAGFVQCFSTIAFTKASEDLVFRTRLRAFTMMLRREMSWFDEDSNNVGSLTHRLSQDAVALKVTSTVDGLLNVSAWFCLGSHRYPNECLLVFSGCSDLCFCCRLHVGMEISIDSTLLHSIIDWIWILARKDTNTSWPNESDQVFRRGRCSSKVLYFFPSLLFRFIHQWAMEAIQEIRTVATLKQEQTFIDKYRQVFKKDFK